MNTSAAMSIMKHKIKKMINDTRYPGFKEVCLVPGKSDIAFVEYEADHKATVAKDVLNRFKITHDKEMKVIFARR
ncbi:12749_t:CDS:2 [Entrophospora sp. SA101]|nr:12749_t:CDS:2 [Entrophospora sp. SA101]